MASAWRLGAHVRPLGAVMARARPVPLLILSQEIDIVFFTFFYLHPLLAHIHACLACVACCIWVMMMRKATDRLRPWLQAT
jgi:hypothetical protein